METWKVVAIGIVVAVVAVYALLMLAGVVIWILRGALGTTSILAILDDIDARLKRLERGPNADDLAKAEPAELLDLSLEISDIQLRLENIEHVLMEDVEKGIEEVREQLDRIENGIEFGSRGARKRRQREMGDQDPSDAAP